jgi:hypothetical protein
MRDLIFYTSCARSSLLQLVCEQLFTRCSFYPILKLSQMIFAHHDKVFLCRSCYIQQVTDYRNQHHKKPHWDHNLLICFIKSKDRSNKFLTGNISSGGSQNGFNCRISGHECGKLLNLFTNKRTVQLFKCTPHHS